jgi:ABC-2 type transport system ATP-binding protein
VNGTIDIQDVVVRYGDTTAVDGLSARLEGGRIHGLLGRNGSGKTSLLSVVAAFRRAEAGTVTLDGRPIYEDPIAVGDICFIRGAGDTVGADYPGDRVGDALDFAAATRRCWDATYTGELLDSFEVSRKKRLGELSRGQRSAVGITLGLASRAPVTIFDESYLGMDAPSRYAFYDLLLADFAEHPRTFVLSTHLIEEVASLFEEVVIIDNGRLVLHEQADALRAHGATVTGSLAAVDRFTAGRTVLAEKQLGPTKQATIYGVLDERDRAAARAAGLELGPVGLQELFVHLTAAREDGR